MIPVHWKPSFPCIQTKPARGSQFGDNTGELPGNDNSNADLPPFALTDRISPGINVLQSLPRAWSTLPVVALVGLGVVVTNCSPYFASGSDEVEGRLQFKNKHATVNKGNEGDKRMFTWHRRWHTPHCRSCRYGSSWWPTAASCSSSSACWHRESTI